MEIRTLDREATEATVSDDPIRAAETAKQLPEISTPDHRTAVAAAATEVADTTDAEIGALMLHLNRDV